MFQLFNKKKSLEELNEDDGIKVYELRLYYEKGHSNRIYYGLRDFDRFYKTKPPLFKTALFFNKYLRLHPDKYKDYELEILEQKSKNRYDVENVGMNGLWCASQRFKDFIDQEDIPLDFFPVKVEGERRHLMMWRNLPVISDYEVDIPKNRYWGRDKDKLDCAHPVFRSDFIEYYGSQIFSEKTYTYIFVTNTLKKKLEQQDFKFTFEEKQVTQKKLNSQKIKKDLIYARNKEREILLSVSRYQKLQEVDDYLEKVLIEEGDKKILERFKEEMKGKWKKDFERYEQGIMEPLEKIMYW
jgi:hypothetical protein